MLLLSLSLFFLSCYDIVDAGSVSRGGACNIANNRLQAGTYQFYSDCDSVTYCASNSTCLKRGCRKDIFPFGYVQDSDNLPPLCKQGTFCPDEMDACQPVLAVDSPCQLNRDDQCAGPPNFDQLADNSGMGLNFNGSVCINNVCMWANVTAGQDCAVENTAYIAYGKSGEEFIDIVSRGNCRLGLYCDSQQKKCVQQKDLNTVCDADKECASFNCLASGVCGKSAAEPNHFGAWVYVVVGFGIFGGMFGTLTSLFLWHRRQREKEREKRLQYWREQNTFHENIRQMRETAEASILSLPGHGGTSSGRQSPQSDIYNRDYSEDVQQPILQQHTPNKTSGLRYHLADDNSTEFSHDERLLIPQPRSDGRF
jgi:hypothetical protein